MMAAAATLRRLRRCTAGNSLLEAAVVLPLGITMLVGIMDFGMAYRTRAIAEKSMQNAARYLSTLPPSAVCGWGWTNAQNLAVTGKLAAVSSSNPPLISNWKTSDIHRTAPTSCAKSPVTIDIYADVPYSPFFMRTSLRMKAYHQERWIGQ